MLLEIANPEKIVTERDEGLRLQPHGYILATFLDLVQKYSSVSGDSVVSTSQDQGKKQQL